MPGPRAGGFWIERADATELLLADGPAGVEEETMMADPLFAFVLTPLDQIEPWGQPESPNLHWFGLADSFYWMNVSGQKLYQYSNEARGLGTTEYIDYQVIRLYEDVAEILPHVLEPVPDDLAVVGPSLDGITNNLAEHADVRIFDAGDWWWSRCLTSGHHRYGPRVQFLAQGTSVTLSWDLRDYLHDGVQCWSATHGTLALSTTDLINEWRSFHKRLMSEMAERVERAPAILKNRGIEINVEALRKEQIQRSIYREPIPATTDWEAVRNLLKEFKFM